MSKLPEGWIFVNPLDVALPVRGLTYKKEQATGEKRDGYTAVLRANNIQEDKLVFDDLVYLPDEVIQSQQKLKLNDILIAMSSGSISVVGKSAQVTKDTKASFGAFCGVLRPSLHVDPRYFGYFLRSAAYRSAISNMARGVNINNLKWSHFESIPFPLAPLAEQKRIADKLDAVLARVDECRERLDRAYRLLKNFRQSVFDDATSGRLSQQWRGGRAPSWEKLRAADVCAKVQSGGTPKSGFVDAPGVPFLKVYNIVDQKVSFDYRPQFIPQDVHEGVLAKSVTLPGDVLMNIVGPPLGKVAVVSAEYPEWNINQAITLFRPSAQITTGWLYIVLCGGKNIRGIVNETRGSAGQTNISLSQCRDFVFPVPPVDEQREIVRQVNMLFAFADAIEERVDTARNATERLVPALLAKAFLGGLVPQCPNDEPAEKLLERVKALTTSLGTDGKRSKRSSTAVAES